MQSHTKPWPSFVDGLVSPSPVAVGIAVLLNALIFSALVLGLTPRFLASKPTGFLAENATDYDAFVTSQILALQAHPIVEPMVIVLGASTTRAALLYKDLSEGLDSRGFHDVRVVKLCTSRQSLWETLALVENLPAGARGVVVLGVGPSLFSMGSDDLTELAHHPRLGIRSKYLDSEFQAHAIPVRNRSANYFFDNAAFLLARLDVLPRTYLRSKRTAYVDSRYVGKGAATTAAWELKGKRVDSRLAHLRENWLQNLGVLERIINLVRSRTNLKVVLVESPLNPRFVAQFDREALVAWHRQGLARFARTQGIPYVVLDQAAGLSADDFFDWAHLSDPAAIKRSADAVLGAVGSPVDPTSERGAP
jgi:hypothetical protein